MASFTGAWRTRAYGRTDETFPLGAADPRRHMADWSTGHGVDDTAITRRAISTPFGLDYPPPDVASDSTDTYAASTDPVGVPMNEEGRDHGFDFDYGNGSTNNVDAPNSSLKHGDTGKPSPLHYDDKGSMWARRIRQPRLNQWDETFSTPRFVPNRGITQSDRQRFLGNQWAAANPDNNPEHTVQRTRGDAKAAESPPVGWHGEPRAGFRVQRWDLRKIAMHYVHHNS